MSSVADLQGKLKSIAEGQVMLGKNLTSLATDQSAAFKDLTDVIAGLKANQPVTQAQLDDLTGSAQALLDTLTPLEAQAAAIDAAAKAADPGVSAV